MPDNFSIWSPGWYFCRQWFLLFFIRVVSCPGIPENFWICAQHCICKIDCRNLELRISSREDLFCFCQTLSSCCLIAETEMIRSRTAYSVSPFLLGIIFSGPSPSGVIRASPLGGFWVSSLAPEAFRISAILPAAPWNWPMPPGEKGPQMPGSLTSMDLSSQPPHPWAPAWYSSLHQGLPKPAHSFVGCPSHLLGHSS